MQKYYESKIDRIRRHYQSEIDALKSGYGAVVNALSERNEAMAASMSWRITRPLRVLMRLIRNDSGTKTKIKNMFRRPKGLPEPVQQPESEPARQSEPPQAEPPPDKLSVIYIAEGPPTCVGYDYRCKYYAQAMEAIGAKARVISIGDVAGSIADIRRADVLIIWRSAFYAPIQAAVAAARSNGAIIIFDVDDLIFEPCMANISIIDGIRFHGLDAAYFESVRDTAAASDVYLTPTNTIAMYLRKFGRPAYKFVNGFDDEAFLTARLAARKRRVEEPDGLFRIGYAGGTKTHQKDFSVAVKAVARILKEYPDIRLVLFIKDGERLLDISEFQELAALEGQIEWRDFVPHHQFPAEIARFDISLAPLETGNPFCESKSELKFFESALAGACVIASPTEPYKNAVLHGVTGFLAETEEEWYECMKKLTEDHELRGEMKAAAFRSVLWPFGYQRRVIAVSNMMNQIFGERQNKAVIFAYETAKQNRIKVPRPLIADHDIVFHKDALGVSYVTVIVPLYNYEHYVTEALDSVKTQTLKNIDLVIVDDKSTDNSLDTAMKWAKANAGAFNRVVIAANRKNSKLSMARNTAFELAETPYIFPLDPDNRLLPECLEKCLDAILKSGASFAYPLIQHFGDDDYVTGNHEYDPTLLSGGNYIDAMAMIAKSAWAEAGGYRNFSESGWEDYSLWCTLSEKGMAGVKASGVPLAEYRVHKDSMLRTVTDVSEKKRRIINEAELRHPWITLIEKIDL